MQGNNQKDGSREKGPALSWSQPPASIAAGAAAQKNAASTAPKLPLMPQKTPMTALMPPSYGRKTVAAYFAGGLLLGALFGWMWFADSDTRPVAQEGNKVSNTAGAIDVQNTATNTQSQSALSSGSTLDILVETQSAGLGVNVSNVKVQKPTWIAVYESRGGSPGNILGASLFFPLSQGGSSTGVVSLLRATSAGQTYFVGQYVDNGDRRFSMQSDTRVLGEDGEPLITSFKTR